ncbi:MAG: LLM class flavin-dependent oxidoreductase [Acidimicrobiaceae bacterium]|nr:LLM class flavin-dependent oxidoreductase [Acidimicrobiaceae bacterium]
MKLGVLLPTFRDTVEDSLRVAQRCEEFGIDGVFAYDHLWPMGSPTRPSFAPFPVLAAVAARHPSLHVGPLVARVGMVGPVHLIEQFRSLAALAPGRVIAALGTGDVKSRDELVGYGLKVTSADQRRSELELVARALRDEMMVWIGAGAEATNALARQLEVVLNVWNVDTDQIATLATQGPVTWAGTLRGNLDGLLDELRFAGAKWAVFAPGVDEAALGHWRERSG